MDVSYRQMFLQESYIPMYNEHFLSLYCELAFVDNFYLKTIFNHHTASLTYENKTKSKMISTDRKFLQLRVGLAIKTNLDSVYEWALFMQNHHQKLITEKLTVISYTI